MIKTAIENKHKIRKEHGSFSTLHKIAKAESKKLVWKDKIIFSEKQLHALNNIPPHKQYYAAIKKIKINQITSAGLSRIKNVIS